MSSAPRPLGLLFGVLAAPLGLALLGAVVVTPLPLRAQALFGLALFALALLLSRLTGRVARLTLVMLSVAVSSRYLFWRLTATVESGWTVDVMLGTVLLLAELYAFVMLLLGYFQTLEPLQRTPAPLPEDVGLWPSVDVYIPTYNEPLAVVRMTVLAARAMDWPADRLHVYLLDDGRRDEFRAFAAQAEVGYLVRPNNAHAKAGNINQALARTRGDYVAIFDCDHVPTRSFLQLTLGGFLADPKLAMIQTPHHFYSPDPFERNLSTFGAIPNEGELFYGLIQPGNDLWNGAFFCGSCAVLRRSALTQVGGVAVETVTEDAHTALRMHRAGWNTAYLDLRQAAGLATETLSAHVGQRIRWARGMVQILRMDNPLFGRGLTLAQRLCYLGSLGFFFFGVPRLVFLAAPISYLVFDRQIFNALPLVAASYALPHLAHCLLTNSRVQGKVRHLFWSDVYEAAIAFHVAVVTTVTLLSPRRGKFNVTPKGGQIERDFFDARIAAPNLVLAALNLTALALGAHRLQTGAGAPDVLVMNMIWCGYNLLVLGTAITVAFEKRQLRSSPRVTVKLPAMLRVEGGRTLRCQTIDLAQGGALVSLTAAHAPGLGDKVALSVFSHTEETPLEAEVVSQQGGRLRLRFRGLDLQQEGALVAAMFSRADSWLSWGQGRARGNPLSALGGVLRQAVQGARASLGGQPVPAHPPGIGRVAS